MHFKVRDHAVILNLIRASSSKISRSESRSKMHRPGKAESGMTLQDVRFCGLVADVEGCPLNIGILHKRLSIGQSFM